MIKNYITNENMSESMKARESAPGLWIPSKEAAIIFKKIPQAYIDVITDRFEDVCLIGCINLQAATIAGLIYFSIKNQNLKNLEKLEQSISIPANAKNGLTQANTANRLREFLSSIQRSILNGETIKNEEKSKFVFSQSYHDVFEKMYKNIIQNTFAKNEEICKKFCCKIFETYANTNEKPRKVEYSTQNPKLSFDIIINYSQFFFGIQRKKGQNPYIGTKDVFNKSQTIPIPNIPEDINRIIENKNNLPLQTSMIRKSQESQSRASFIRGMTDKPISISDRNTKHAQPTNFSSPQKPINNTWQNVNQSPSFQRAYQGVDNSSQKGQHTQFYRNEETSLNNIKNQISISSDEKSKSNLICSRCQNLVDDLFLTEDCSHKFCRVCLIQEYVPDTVFKKCMIPTCQGKMDTIKMEIFHVYGSSGCPTVTTQLFTSTCEYCLKTTEIQTEHKPEYLKCSNCKAITCLLHATPKKLEECYCQCPKCFAETKMNGKMKECPRCKAAFCSKCQSLSKTSGSQCQCPCKFCSSPTLLNQSGNPIACECMRFSCALCLCPINDTSLKLTKKCIHSICSPCYFIMVAQNQQPPDSCMYCS